MRHEGKSCIALSCMKHTVLWPTSRMIRCIHCGREFHSICVLHHPGIWNEGYQCDGCLKIKGKSRRESKFCAKRESVP